MKKITFLLFAFFLCLQMSAQLYQVPTCSGGISSNTYGPMNSVATVNATNRTAVIYPSSQLATLTGQDLNAVYFKRMAATGSMAGTPNFKVYLKETSAVDFGAAALDWATEIAGATLVYDSNPSAAVGSSAGWKSFTFSTNFTYSGTQNLAVYMEYVNTTASTAIGWDYEYGSPCISTTNNNTTKYINNTTGTPGTSLTSSNYRRPQIGFDFVVSCPAPTAFNYANLTATTVDLNWIAGGAEGAWEYVIQPSASPAPTSGTGIGANAVIGAVVSPNTAYTAYVRADCGGGDFSVWKTVSFTTPCSTSSVPYLENFATFVPSCWSLADNGDLTAGPATFGSSSWIADGFGNVGTTGAVRVNLDATGDNDWILSPMFAVPATGYELKFDASANQWASTSAPTTAWEADDFVQVLVSTGTTNWTVLYTYNNTNVPSNTGSTNILDLDAYAGQTVRFAFRGFEGATNGGADIEFIVDNFEIRLSPACSNPISLAVNSLTYNSANITWAPTTGSYEYVLDNVATDPAGSGTPLSGEIYGASLSPLTTYYFHVRTVCPGPIYSVWSTISFTTPATPPANDDCSGAIALTVNPDFSCSAVTPGTVLGATTSAIDATVCFGTEDDDVWFSFVATQTSHRISLLNVAGSVTDMFHSLWTGVDCNSLALVPGSCSDPDTSNPSGLVIGQTYYVRVNTYTAVGGQTSTFNICIGTPPPPPANDGCATATGIVTLPYTNTQDATAATNTGGFIATCTTTSGMNDGVWYSVVGNGSDITVNINGVVGWDPELAVYTGTCGAFTCVGSVDVGASGGSETYTIVGSVIGTTYFINIGYYSGTTNASEGPFTINVTTNLSTDSFDSAAFKAYPNPVNNVLNLSYSSEISSVEVYNMLGQKVIAKALNVTQGQIDMSNLTSGNYFVKVTSEGLTKTIKVVKK